MKTNVNMLMMRVEAADLIGSYSIKTVIEGHLLESDGFTQKAFCVKLIFLCLAFAQLCLSPFITKRCPPLADSQHIYVVCV